MAEQIDTVTSRGRLKPRREPYWHRIRKGCFVGYRLMNKGASGTWLARAWDEGKGRDAFHPLGDFGDLPDHKRFDAATAAAAKWFEHVGRGGSTSAVTLRAACERYIEHLRQEKPKVALTPYAVARRARKGLQGHQVVPAAEDAEARFKRYVYTDARLSATPLTKLTPAMFDEWRKRLQAQPTRGGGNRGEARSASTMNRDITCLRAALNLALLDELVTTDFAWRGRLRPIKDADRRRDGYLDKPQRRKFIQMAPPDLAQFLSGLSMLPLRPGALAALTAADFDKRLGVLRIGTDKAGGDRRIKLPKATAEFFEAAIKDKLPAAPIFARADGRAWDKDGWKWPVKAAATAAKLPAGTTAYTLRHSTITDLVHDGLDLLTVAQISGTSVKMIEQHYGHMRGDVAAAALERLAL
jgi:hypothetical protein